MTATTDRRALTPGGPRGSRAERARSEAMAVLAVGDGAYDVVTEDDHVYTVDLSAGTCTCPDYRVRGARCKHLRRVAIDVTEGRVPPPGMREATCGDCGREFFVVESTPDPAYCTDCTLRTGETAVDRESDDLVIVARTTNRRADGTPISGTEYTVASYPGNADYDPADQVIEVLYPLPRGLDPDDVRPHHLRTYSFPRGRLERRE